MFHGGKWAAETNCGYVEWVIMMMHHDMTERNVSADIRGYRINSDQSIFTYDLYSFI